MQGWRSLLGRSRSSSIDNTAKSQNSHADSVKSEADSNVYSDAGEISRNRDPFVWIAWKFLLQEEMLPLKKQVLPEAKKPFRATGKRICRHGALHMEKRRKFWLNMLEFSKDSLAYSEARQMYTTINKRCFLSCAGCEALLDEHLPHFGARYLKRWSLWEENVFDKHALSDSGKRAAKRTLMVLHEKLRLDYCPQIPDLVCVMLLYMSEEDVFVCLNRMVKLSRKRVRWNPQRETCYLPIGQADNLLFAKTFVALVKERLPLVYRALVAAARDMEEIESYFQGWFERTFVTTLPLRFVVRIVDCIIVEGAKVYYLVGMALLKYCTKFITDTFRRRPNCTIAELMEECLHELGSVEESRTLLAMIPKDADQGWGALVIPPNEFRSESRSSKESANDLSSEENTSPRRRRSSIGFRASLASDDDISRGIINRVPTYLDTADLAAVHDNIHEYDASHLELPNRESDSDSDNDQENVIVLQNRVGSKVFFSESSLFRSNTAAGAALMEKMRGTGGPVLTHLAITTDNFEFKVLLAQAFSFRNVSSKMLSKLDQRSSIMLTRESRFSLDQNYVPAHFSKHVLTKSSIIHDHLMATRLISWLPDRVKLNSRKMKLCFTTTSVARGLNDLYEACAVSKCGHLMGSIVLIQTTSTRSTTIFGAYVNSNLEPSEKFVSNDESCFLFRLGPLRCATKWDFRGRLRQALSTGPASMRYRLHVMSKGYESDSDEAILVDEPLADPSIYEAARTVDEAEQEIRCRFYQCGAESLVFGGTSVVYKSDDITVIEPDDMIHMTDEELRRLHATESSAGPGLYIDKYLMKGHTGWCTTFGNAPLCVDTSCGRGTSNDELHRYFEISGLEVWGIPYPHTK